MPEYKYKTLIGCSSALCICSGGFSVMPETWGKPVGLVILLIGTIIGCITFGYQWGFDKAKSRER